MLSYRYDLNVWNAPKDIQNACMGTESPIVQSGSLNLASRTVIYARGGVQNQKLIQTGVGNSFINSGTIPALFERTNITLATENGPVPFSNKVYVHRVFPEIAGTGSINITVGGANSTAQAAKYGATGVTAIDTDTPWVPTQQQAVRTVALKVASNDATDTWNLSAMNWQTTIVEDAY